MSKKYRKYLGSRTARRGIHKRNRGAGNRGGRGMAGWRLKKQKYIMIVKNYPEKFEDRKGFNSPKVYERNIINLYEIEEYFDYLLENDLIKKEDDYYVINLNELGVDKLLSKGNISKKVKIIVKEASKKAIEKVKKAGGEVVLA